ncbi:MULTISPECIES: hypothetical protein [unclassified Phenylobacterium]|uniref:hypothetical protein n=1 Tax=unclassified Phenylobacterium TaxID=2640670 RepID=UPI000AF89407|nr:MULTISPECIES: hypothetical protein [unclassified Phenylobacterium]
MDKAPPPPAYEFDIAPDGEGWRYRKRWTKGLRRFLPALWHATDAAGVKTLRETAHR